MTDRQRAAALADEIGRNGLTWAGVSVRLSDRDESLIVAALAALEAAGYPLTPVVAGQTVGPGLIAVPIEPTEEMEIAGDDVAGSSCDAPGSVLVYEAMLSALARKR